MKFLSVENEVDQAIQMVNSDESTDPKVVTEVANYKEELEKLLSEFAQKKVEVNMTVSRSDRDFEDSYVDLTQIIHMEI